MIFGILTLRYFRKNGELVNIQESYDKLYDLSELTEVGQNILEAFSVFPYILLAVETCNEWRLADAGVSEDDDILMELYRKGWLRLGVEQENYALHTVFVKFIYEKRRPIEEKHVGLIEVCQEYLQIPESGSILKCRLYIPFAENIIEKVIIDIVERRIELVDSLAYRLLYIREYEKARNVYEKNLEIYEGELGEDNQYYARIYGALEVIYTEMGQYEKPEENYIDRMKGMCRERMPFLLG